MKLHLPLLALLICCGMQAPAAALVATHDKGIWPADWPRELEPFRADSKTLDVATGIQEHIYQIPMTDRETFEKLWPVLLKVRTPGSPIRLSRAGEDSKSGWGDFLSNKTATVRIYGPSGGYSVLKDLASKFRDPAQRIDVKKLVEDGRAVFAGKPWPKELVGKNGELPEYVTATEQDGRITWIPADPSAKDASPRFYQRARIELELIVDGNVIDLNRIRIPDDARIIDHRFESKE